MLAPIVSRVRALTVRQQDGLVALVVFALATPVYLLGAYRLNPADQVPLTARFVELAVLCGLMLLRRRQPLGLLLATALVVADVLVSATMPILLLYTDSLYCATLYGSRRTSRGVIRAVAVAVVTITGLVFALTADWRQAVIGALSPLSLLVTPVWWAATIRQHQGMADAERANAAQLARIAELDRRAALVAERATMARDLHDVIAGHLSAIAIQSEAALSLSDRPDTARQVLESVRANSVDALTEMRTMITLLRADDPAREVTAPGRLAELSRLVDSARASGLPVTVESTVDCELPAAVDQTAYRIAQEALANTARHAPGGAVTVRVRRQEQVLTVEIGNEPGDRPARASGTGCGLANMRERADAVGGTLTAGPAGTGWLVRADLPIGDRS